MDYSLDRFYAANSVLIVLLSTMQKWKAQACLHLVSDLNQTEQRRFVCKKTLELKKDNQKEEDDGRGRWWGLLKIISMILMLLIVMMVKDDDGEDEAGKYM